MADIILGERTKKILRMVLKTGYKFLKKDMNMISEDLKYSQNPVVKNLNTLLLLTGEQLNKVNYQKRMVLGYGQAFLWIVSKDTAYRDAFFWSLDKLLEHPEELRKILKPYVKPPNEWIPNLWQDSRLKTRKNQQQGKLPKYAKCLEETIFTPDIQNKRHKKILNKK